jgi:hypothetical protein
LGISCPGVGPWAALVLTLEFAEIKARRRKNASLKKFETKQIFLIGKRYESNENVQRISIESFPQKLWIHLDRIAGGNSDHCNFGGNVIAGFVQGQRKGERDYLYQQS